MLSFIRPHPTPSRRQRLCVQTVGAVSVLDDVRVFRLWTDGDECGACGPCVFFVLDGDFSLFSSVSGACLLLVVDCWRDVYFSLDAFCDGDSLTVVRLSPAVRLDRLVAGFSSRAQYRFVFFPSCPVSLREACLLDKPTCGPLLTRPFGERE